MKGHVRYRAGAWRLVVDVGIDPLTHKRRQIHRTVHGPNNKTGRKAAESALAKLVTESTALRAAPTSGMTVAELIERYIQHKAPGWSPGSAEATRARVAQHITPHIGLVAIERIRPLDISDLHRRWRDAGLGEGTVGRMHDIVRAAFKQAVRWELVPRNPTDPIERPKGKPTEVIPPDPKVLARALDQAGDTLTLYIRLAAITGARRGELVALRGTSFDLPGAQLRITRALVQTKGAVIEKDTKTGDRRALGLDGATVAMVRAHRARQAEAALAIGTPLAPDAYLFAFDPGGQRPWRPDSASHRWDTLRAKDKQLAGVRLHDLRHWMATALMAGGFGIVEVAGRGGWAGTDQPGNRYGHFQPANDQRAADHLAKLLDG